MMPFDIIRPMTWPSALNTFGSSVGTCAGENHFCRKHCHTLSCTFQLNPIDRRFMASSMDDLSEFWSAVAASLESCFGQEVFIRFIVGQCPNSRIELFHSKSFLGHRHMSFAPR